MNKPQHGGPREGSGRPKQDDAGKTDRHNVSLDKATVNKAKKLGNGNLSLGIRVAVRRADGLVKLAKDVVMANKTGTDEG